LTTLIDQRRRKVWHEAGHAALALYFGILGPGGVTIVEGDEEAGSTCIQWDVRNLENAEATGQRITVVMGGVAAEPAALRSDIHAGEITWAAASYIHGDLSNDIQKARCLEWISQSTSLIWMQMIQPLLDATPTINLDEIIVQLRNLPEYENSVPYEGIQRWFRTTQILLTLPQPSCFVRQVAEELFEHETLAYGRCKELWDNCAQGEKCAERCTNPKRDGRP
jgi:hypothetical protein